MNNPVNIVTVVGFLVLLVFYTFFAKSAHKRIGDKIKADFEQMRDKYQLQQAPESERRYFVLANKLGSPRGFLVCEATGFAIADKKALELERIPYTQIRALILPMNVVFGKAQLMKIDGSLVPVRLCRDIGKYEKDWPTEFRNKVLMRAFRGSKINTPGKAATKQTVLLLRRTYTRLAKACEKHKITIETTGWYRKLEVELKSMQDW
jgi:hypothetical protein